MNQISVREESGKRIINELIGRDTEVVADPVLLLNASDWENTLPAANCSEGYIFLYTTHTTAEIKAFVKALARQTGLKVVTSTWRGGAREAIEQGITKVQAPDVWLRQLHDAEYVVTNSFHATAFSVLFHKKFFTVLHGGESEGNNIRLYDFLGRLNLQERIINSAPDRIPSAEINFSESDKTIDDMRKRSVTFLRENLEAAYQQKLELESKGKR